MRCLKDGPLLDEMIAHQTELAILRKRCALLVYRSILEMENEVGLDQMAFGELCDFSVGERLTIEGPQPEKAVR
jgi:hypothetical protein